MMLFSYTVSLNVVFKLLTNVCLFRNGLPKSEIDMKFQMFNFHSPQTNLPIFKLKETRVRRRYSDFEWLRGELERESKVKDR